MRRLILLFTLLTFSVGFSQTYIGYGIPPSKYGEDLIMNMNYINSGEYPIQFITTPYKAVVTNNDTFFMNSIDNPYEGYYGTLTRLDENIYYFDDMFSDKTYGVYIVSESTFIFEDFKDKWKWFFIEQK